MPSPSRSGAFQVDVDKAVEKFTESISFDYRLAQHDIAGSIAHANMLADQQIISAADAKQIIETLTAIGQEIEQDKFVFREDLEDIHMNIENALIERIGDVGRKLHTARSRNDQVATDQRIWIRDQIDQLDAILKQNQIALVTFAERESATIIPAYTHLQRAQPVLASHYLLAFCEKFQRDRERLQDCRKRVNLCSLGTAALAGTSLPIDRNATAKALGFDGLVRNSLDSSSDRDYVIEFVFCLSLIAIHLSRVAEDFVIWSSTEFDFIELPEQYCTGSSIMPQKINPDVMELIRGKSARVIGSLQTLLVLAKGLPMAYNRDLQEDKPALFDAVDTVAASLELMRGVIDGAKLKRDAISAGLEQGYLDATTLMEFLIKGGMPQRKAHHLIGQIVRAAMTENVSLAEFPLSAYQAFEPSLDDSVFEVLGVNNAIHAFTSEGSTAPDRVAAELKRWKKDLGEI